MLLVLALLLSQTGTCKAGVNCQANSYRSVTSQPDAGAAFAASGNGYIQLTGVTAANKPLCNAARKGALQFIRYTNDSGYEMCNGIEWIAAYGGGSGGTSLPGCVNNADGGIICRMYSATSEGLYGVEIDAGIQTSDGGGLGMTRVPAYNCSGVVNGVPCVANTNGIVEIYGSLPVAETTPFVCAVEVYQYNTLGASADTCVMGLGVGASSTKIIRFTGDGSAHLSGSLHLSGPKIVGRTGGYLEVQTNAASNGVAMYLSNTGGTLASAGSMLSFYNPGYSGSNVMSVEHDGALKFLGATTGTLGTCNAGNAGRMNFDTSLAVMKVCNGAGWQALVPFHVRVTLTAGSGTGTVPSGAECQCTNVTDKDPNGCSVSGTTLSVFGEGSDTILATCFY